MLVWCIYMRACWWWWCVCVFVCVCVRSCLLVRVCVYDCALEFRWWTRAFVACEKPCSLEGHYGKRVMSMFFSPTSMFARSNTAYKAKTLTNTKHLFIQHYQNCTFKIKVKKVTNEISKKFWNQVKLNCFSFIWIWGQNILNVMKFFVI